MDYIDLLLEEHSRLNTERIAQMALKDKAIFDDIMHRYGGEDALFNQRAAWVISIISDQNPNAFVGYEEKLLKMLVEEHHPAIKRNISRMMMTIPIPDLLHGKCLDIFFEMLNHPQEHHASRANAMSVLERLSKIYPEIEPELSTSLTWILETTSAPSLQSRVKKTITLLQKRAHHKKM